MMTITQVHSQSRPPSQQKQGGMGDEDAAPQADEGRLPRCWRARTGASSHGGAPARGQSQDRQEQAGAMSRFGRRPPAARRPLPGPFDCEPGIDDHQSPKVAVRPSGRQSFPAGRRGQAASILRNPVDQRSRHRPAGGSRQLPSRSRSFKGGRWRRGVWPGRRRSRFRRSDGFRARPPEVETQRHKTLTRVDGRGPSAGSDSPGL